MDASGRTDAAALLALYGWPERPGLVFTKRRSDLRKHAGEISFPGGRSDELDESLSATALREANEEIGLSPGAVEVVGALPPVGTFVTSYKIHPFVGLIGNELAHVPNQAEVEEVLSFSFDELRGSYAMRRLVRRGIPIHTPSYSVGDHLIWGATARILGDLLERLSFT